MIHLEELGHAFDHVGRSVVGFQTTVSPSCTHQG